MRILISNDDGVTAPGLAALYAALADFAECVVIAPDQDKSGASSSLTLDRPLHPCYLDNGFISLNGTPTDCVHLGLNGLLEREPDMVVSGINLGANLGGRRALFRHGCRRPGRSLPGKAIVCLFRLFRGRSIICRPPPTSPVNWSKPTASWSCRHARC
nr:hypothetical protein GCM10020185_16260 [Pseudomonas brassicacearum subsp. brassicacearum]